MRLEKIILIGAKIPASLNAIFQGANFSVTNVSSGKIAVSRAQREMFDAAILISTGEEMDLAETVFNLRDINDSMELIILSDHTNTIKSAVPKKTLAGLVSHATVMTAHELKKHFNSF
jgi:DNA-binding NtrC family response regulator